MLNSHTETLPCWPPEIVVNLSRVVWNSHKLCGDKQGCGNDMEDVVVHPLSINN